MNRFLGVDLRKNMFVVCFYDGDTCEQKVRRYNFEDTESFKKELRKGDVVGVESIFNTRYFVEQIRDCVKVINPSQFAVICKSVKKTDKYDAKLIAEYLNKGMVPEARLKAKMAAQINSLTGTRDKLGRTTLVQCTLVAIQYSEYLRKFYEKIKTKKGSGRAIIATSKKLLGIIYKTLKNKWVFEDFPNYVIKTT